MRLSLHFYFEKIIIHGRENIPDGPVIFAVNHQNAFMDALMIVCFNSHFTHFLTRADIFKRPFVRWLLSTLNMLPIYRIRDGRQSMAENQKTFAACARLFIKNEAVVIFPEGNHGSQRRLRPLSKGFARIAFESLQRNPHLKISVVPVGINYSAPSAFRSSVSIYYGRAIAANDYFRHPAQSELNKLRNELAVRLKRLITHVEDPERYQEIIQKLDQSHPDYLSPLDTNERISRIEKGEVLPVELASLPRYSWVHLLFYNLAVVVNLIPIMIWRSIKRGIKDPVFITSLRFGIGIFLFPSFYLLTGALIFGIYGPLVAVMWMCGCLLSLLALK